MITYVTVGMEHEICGYSAPPWLPGHMKAFWRSRSLENSHGAVLAYDGEKLIGFFRYNNGPRKAMYAYGTYVLPKYRSRGVAIKLWKRALRKEKPKHIHVFTTSTGGRKLVEALGKKLTKYKWIVTNFD
jgi:GNAT superfamily N-acetyltransferase